MSESWQHDAALKAATAGADPATAERVAAAAIFGVVRPENEKIDHADDDVRAAVDAVARREVKSRAADEIGLNGARAMRQWDERVNQVGPRAALEYGALSQQQPKPKSLPKFEKTEGDDWYQSALAATATERERAERKSERPAAIAELDRLEAQHGDLNAIDDYRRWHTDINDDPSNAARVATEIQQRQSYDWRTARAAEFVEANSVTPEHMPEMSSYLSTVPSTGDIGSDLAHAKAYADHVAANDIEDERQRDVISARRKQAGAEMWLAAIHVADAEQRHPEIRTNPVLRGKVKALLEQGRARDMDEAFAMARRK